MVRMIVTLLTALLVLFGTTVHQIGAAETPSALFTKAFQVSRQGDVAFETGKFALAAEQYQAALKELERLQATWPTWSPEEVKRRLQHCRFQARQSSARSALPTPPSAPVAAPKPVPVRPAAPAKPVTTNVPASAPPVATTEPASAVARDLLEQAGQLAQAADGALASGDRAGAAKQYNRAIKLLRDLRFEYPNWQPALVSLRLSHCVLQLRNMK